MRRTRKRTRRRRKRQRGGFLDSLKAGLSNGLAAVGLKKKEDEGSDAIQRTHASDNLAQPAPAASQEGGRRRKRSRRRRKSRKSRRSRRGGMCGSCPGDKKRRRTRRRRRRKR